MKVTVITIIIGAHGKRTGRLRNKRTSGDNPNYTISENGQNTEKSPGDLSTLVKKPPRNNNDISIGLKTKIKEN